MGVPIFFSYSHKDERFKNDLETHLSVLKRDGYIETWNDRKIAPGADWKEEINTNLEKAKVILLLISEHFLASDYCYETETIFALEQHEKKRCIVIPVIVKTCMFQRSKLSHLQALPKGGMAITEWRNRGAAWVSVVEGIIKAIEDHPNIMHAKDFSKITFGPSIKSQDAVNGEPIALGPLLLRFLAAYRRWYFSPLRIQTWGGRQKGFETLSGFSTTKIRLALKRLLAEAKVKTVESKNGHLLYRLSGPDH